MFLHITSLLVGFLCLLLVLLMLANVRFNQQKNIYLIIILFIVGAQRFIHAFEALELTHLTYSPLKIRPIIGLFIIPVYYLFFRRLILNKVEVKKEVIHFIAPSLFLFFDLFFKQYSVSYMVFLFFSSAYFLGILGLMKGLYRKRTRNMLEMKTNKAIRNWATIMTIISFMLVLSSNYFLFSATTVKITLVDFYGYSSFLWLVALLYLLQNPVIVFGENNLIKQISVSQTQDFLIWSVKPTFKIQEKDKALHAQMLPSIDATIIKIQQLQDTQDVLKSKNLTVETISKELKLPKSHIAILFKYYCLYSVNDYINLIKVKYAISLIISEFLNNYTIAHLGDHCLFKSRFTFSKNFKKFMGMSVTEYVVLHTNKI